MGKEKGFLTYRDLNSTLPADMVSSERLSSLMTMFGEMDIEIIDSPEGERYQQMMSEGEGTTEEAEEAGETEEEDKKIDLTPGDLARTDDPVRLYLKEMGSVSLLSREGEIEIAKRIEDGKQDISTVVFGMPMTIKAVFALIDQVKANKVPIREVVSAGVEEEFDEVVQQDDEELRRHTLEGVRKGKALAKGLLALYARNRKPNLSPAKRKEIKTKLNDARRQVAEKLDSLNLHPVQRERLIQRVRDLAQEIAACERELAYCRRRLGVAGEEGTALLAKLSRGRRGLVAVRRKTSVPMDVLHDIEKAAHNARRRIRGIESESLVPAEELRESVKLLDQAEEKVKRGKAELVEANLRLDQLGLPTLDLLLGLVQELDALAELLGGNQRFALDAPDAAPRVVGRLLDVVKDVHGDAGLAADRDEPPPTAAELGEQGGAFLARHPESAPAVRELALAGRDLLREIPHPLDQALALDGMEVQAVHLLRDLAAGIVELGLDLFPLRRAQVGLPVPGVKRKQPLGQRLAFAHALQRVPAELLVVLLDDFIELLFHARRDHFPDRDLVGLDLIDE